MESEIASDHSAASIPFGMERRRRQSRGFAGRGQVNFKCRLPSATLSEISQSHGIAVLNDLSSFVAITSACVSSFLSAQATVGTSWTRVV